MPSPSWNQEIDVIKREAITSMQTGRDSAAKRIRRSLRRGWQYGEGKKTTAKIAIGVGFGALFTGLSVASFGTLAPVIAAIAAGSWAVGQMTDLGFAKLYGKKYRGGGSTADWVDNYDTEGSKETAKQTEERAHKTIRRAVFHFQRAHKKMAANKALLDDAGEWTCKEYGDLTVGVLNASRHLRKSRLYAYPALFLGRILLEGYKPFLERFSTLPAAVDERLKEILTSHNGSCGSSYCYAADGAPAILPNDRPLPDLWGWTDVEALEYQIELAENCLASTAIRPPPALVVDRRTKDLFRDAATKHENRSALVKFKHSFANAWGRKTKGERKAWLGGQAVGVVGAAGAGGMAGGMAAAGASMHAALEFLVGYAQQGVELVANEAIDRSSSDAELDSPAPERRNQGAVAAAAAQDAFRKAAIHLFEIQKVADSLSKSDAATDCDSAVARYRQIAKIHHHLGRVQEYLQDGIGLVCMLAVVIDAQKEEVSTLVNRLWEELDKHVRDGPSHSGCRSVCYHRVPPKRL